MSESETSPDINTPRGPERIPGDDSKLNKHSHPIDIDADDDPNIVGRLDRAEIDADDDPDLLSQQVNVDIDPDDDPDLVGKIHSSDIDPDDDPESSQNKPLRERLKEVVDKVYYADPETEPTSDELDQAADELKEAARQKLSLIHI